MRGVHPSCTTIHSVRAFVQVIHAVVLDSQRDGLVDPRRQPVKHRRPSPVVFFRYSLVVALLSIRETKSWCLRTCIVRSMVSSHHQLPSAKRKRRETSLRPICQQVTQGGITSRSCGPSPQQVTQVTLLAHQVPSANRGRRGTSLRRRGRFVESRSTAWSLHQLPFVDKGREGTSPRPIRQQVCQQGMPGNITNRRCGCSTESYMLTRDAGEHHQWKVRSFHPLIGDAGERHYCSKSHPLRRDAGEHHSSTRSLLPKGTSPRDAGEHCQPRFAVTRDRASWTIGHTKSPVRTKCRVITQVCGSKVFMM